MISCLKPFSRALYLVIRLKLKCTVIFLGQDDHLTWRRKDQARGFQTDSLVLAAHTPLENLDRNKPPKKRWIFEPIARRRASARIPR
jgi:hypothetical protein